MPRIRTPLLAAMAARAGEIEKKQMFATLI